MVRLAALLLLATGAVSAADPIYWFVRSGQSLSVGSVGYCGGAYPACASGAAYGSLTIFAPNSLYPPADTQFRTLSGHIYQNLSPAIESSATSMCNQYNVLSGRICATSDYGWPGAGYAALKKGGSGTEYAESIGAAGASPNTGVTQAKVLANAQGSTLYVPAVYFNQGESEMNGSTTASTYEGYMVQLQSDYEADINTNATQSGRVPLFIRQKSSWPAWTGNPTRSTPTTSGGADGVPVGQLQACLDHYSDGKIFCVGPDYDTPYGADGVHKPSATGYRVQGGREGAALYRVTVQKLGWRPFYPRSISLSGNVITVQFWTPTGTALRFDTTAINALPDGNMGFEFSDTGGSGVTLPNNAVALKPATTDSVTITLSGTPAGAFELRYAWTAPNGACPGSCSSVGSNYSGPTNGPRGNVADSSGTAWDGSSLTNYALSFRIPGLGAASPYTWAPADPDLSSVPGPPPALFPLPASLRRYR